VAFYLGAGDENRTRTISLGICRVSEISAPEQQSQMSGSYRDCPSLTAINGTLMARDLALPGTPYPAMRADRPPDLARLDQFMLE
jgi:hypothetical protein